jgi:hypothetical protein
MTSCFVEVVEKVVHVDILFYSILSHIMFIILYYDLRLSPGRGEGGARGQARGEGALIFLYIYG